MVPAFISIPVFRGLFNENLDELNIVLRDLFDVSPGWFSDATLARTMVLIVNSLARLPVHDDLLSAGLIQAAAVVHSRKTANAERYRSVNRALPECSNACRHTQITQDPSYL
ncbi:MAG TPA: hypothetical protein VLW55_21445 [Burkholderiaceae bacterium]|nr:hypothetical protein [Burkholderiaceae bacterium]